MNVVDIVVKGKTPRLDERESQVQAQEKVLGQVCDLCCYKQHCITVRNRLRVHCNNMCRNRCRLI